MDVGGNLEFLEVKICVCTRVSVIDMRANAGVSVCLLKCV